MAVNAPPGQDLPYPAADQRIWDELVKRPIIGLPFTGATGSKLLVEGPVILVAVFARETGAQAGSVDVIDGRDATGQQVASQAIVSGGNVAIAPAAPGLLCTRGVTLVITTSTLKGGVWVQM